METGGARVLVAADGVGPESEVLAAEDIGPESEEVAAEDVVDPLLSVALDSQMPSDSITPKLLDSMEVVPDSLPPGAFVCGRCGLVHEDREAWNRAHSRFCPCPSCGLVHADYSCSAVSRWTASFSWSITRACCRQRTMPKHR